MLLFLLNSLFFLSNFLTQCRFYHVEQLFFLFFSFLGLQTRRKERRGGKKRLKLEACAFFFPLACCLFGKET